MNRASFLFYNDWFDMIKDEPDEQRLALYDAIINYAFEGVEPVNPFIKMAFKLIKGQMDRDNDKWLETKKKRSEAGKKHKGNQYTANKQVETNGTNGTNVPKLEQTGTDGSVNVNDNVNVNVNVNGNILTTKSKDISCMCNSEKLHVPTDITDVVEYWNEAITKNNSTIKQVKKVTTDGQTHKAVRARLIQYGIEDVKQAIDNATTSDFLNQRTSNGGYAANLYWVFRPNNFEKVLAGNYNPDTPVKVDEPNTPIIPMGTNWSKPASKTQVERKVEGQLEYELWCRNNGKNPEDKQTGIEYFNFKNYGKV